MASLLPFGFHPIGSNYLLSNPAGDFFFGDEQMLGRMAEGRCSVEDERYLLERGFAFHRPGDFYFDSFRRRLQNKRRLGERFGYIMAIPTLRCDLACTYCQVSRADEKAKGMDWTEETLSRFLSFLGGLPLDAPKIEFQGGEPTLRLDIIRTVIEFCETRFENPTFVICTNLNRVSDELFGILERPSVSVSTSMDGRPQTHQRNRTKTPDATRRFYENLDQIRSRFGADKVSALPTITPDDFGHITALIDFYREQGFNSIFLRPVNFQGFARKQFPKSRALKAEWLTAYRHAIDYIFDLNASGQGPIYEFGLEVALRRIFSSENGYVDLRSPNPAAADYLVVDHDGRLYPSDEARMLARLGLRDLCIGDLETGLNTASIARLSWNQIGEVHEDCVHCAFQAYCGVDSIDDLSRYNRVDMPKHETWFCQSNTARFEMIFEMLANGEPRDLMNLNGHLFRKLDLTPFHGPMTYDPA